MLAFTSTREDQGLRLKDLELLHYGFADSGDCKEQQQCHTATSMPLGNEWRLSAMSHAHACLTVNNF